LGLRGARYHETVENYIIRSLMICTAHPVLFWWGNLRERDHLGDPGVDGMIILRWIVRKRVVEVRAGSSWLKIGTGGGHL